MIALVVLLLVQVPSRVSAQAGLFVSPDDAAAGMASFLADRAEAEASAFAVELFFRRLCNPRWASHVVSPRALFPHTCRLVTSSTADDEARTDCSGVVHRSAEDESAATSVSLGVIRRALRQDMELLPAHIAEEFSRATVACDPVVYPNEDAGVGDGGVTTTGCPTADAGAGAAALSDGGVAPQWTCEARVRARRAEVIYAAVSLDFAQAFIRTALEHHNAGYVLEHPQSIHENAFLDEIEEAEPMWEKIDRALAAIAAADFIGKLERLPQDASIDRALRLVTSLSVVTDGAAADAGVADGGVADAGGAIGLNEQSIPLDALAALAALALERARGGEEAPSRADVLRAALDVARSLERPVCDVLHQSGTPWHQRCTNGWGDAFEVVELVLAEDYAGAVAVALGSEALWKVVKVALVNDDRGGGDARLIAWLERARRYITLVAELATAVDADSFEAALERFSAPVGTWRRKHEVPFGLSLQGYAGVIGAWERAVGRTQGLELEDVFSLAPTLSVGFQLHWSVGKRAAERLFVYVPLIDVGNVISVRLGSTNDDTLTNLEPLPDITWAQLFAPGAYVGFSLGRSPLDVGLGFNYVPALRRVSGDDGFDVAVMRVGLFVSVDVTLMPLY